MTTNKIKNIRRIRRRNRIKAKLRGTESRPRICVKRSLRNISAQLIDDSKGRTLLYVTDRDSGKGKKLQQNTKSQRAYDIGRILAEKALKLGIRKAIFDRREYLYHGRVSELAKGARDGGLKF